MEKMFEKFAVHTFKEVKNYIDATGNRFFMYDVKENILNLGMKIAGMEHVINSEYTKVVKDVFLENHLSYTAFLKTVKEVCRPAEVELCHLSSDILYLIKTLSEYENDINDENIFFKNAEITLYQMFFQSLDLEKSFYENNENLIQTIMLFVDEKISVDCAVETILFSYVEWEKQSFEKIA